MTDRTTPYDIFISHDEEDNVLAARLRDDLPLAKLTVCPHSTYSPDTLAECRVLVTLQSRHKAPGPVRAAMAAAQATETPIVSVYTQGEQIALRRVGRDPIYDSYGQGVVQLVYAVWAMLDDVRGQMVVENPLETGEDPLVWLAKLAREQGAPDDQLPPGD
ncbi:MAG: hypothetical protein AAF125_02265 [Chloroflexota bacterium]